MRGLAQLTAIPKILSILSREDSDEPSHTQEEASETYGSLDSYKKDAAWVTKEAQNGFPLLHAHSVVGLWSAIEVYCEDLAIAWLKNVPEAWSSPEVAKLKIPLGIYQTLSDNERTRFVIKELSRLLNADLRKGVGKLKALLSVFNLAPAVGPNVQRAIHELYQVRNVIVHTGSRADQKLLDECPWLGYSLGDVVGVRHNVYIWYYHAARRYAERLLNQVFLGVGLPGCECPGMDEIGPRPSEEKLEIRKIDIPSIREEFNQVARAYGEADHSKNVGH
jgi:hypothetical protein